MKTRYSLLLLIIVLITSPFLGFAQENIASSKMGAMLQELEIELINSTYNFGLNKQTQYEVKDKDGNLFFIRTNANVSLNKGDLSRLFQLKNVVDNLKSINKNKVTYFIDPSGPANVTILPNHWDYANIQFQNYVSNGIIFLIKDKEVFYSFRVRREDKSALVYGKYSEEEILNEEVYRTLLINFGIEPALYESKIGSSINLWVGSGTLGAISYEQRLYKGLHLGFIGGFTMNVDQTINTISLIQGTDSASIQVGLRLSYYFVNMSGLTPYVFLTNLSSLTLKGMKYNNIMQLGFGILISTWFFVEGTYNINTLTGVNNASIGIGFRIPLN